MQNPAIIDTASGGIRASHIERFRAGNLTFEQMTRLYPGHTLVDLAEALGFQYPERIVSIRHVNDGEWPFEDIQQIRHARQAYDLGTHEMATGREFLHFVLYLFPRRVPRNTSLYYFRQAGEYRV